MEVQETNIATRVSSGKELKPDDLRQYSNIFASEFNNNSLHDRVLVFQVVTEEEFASNQEGVSDESDDLAEYSNVIVEENRGDGNHVGLDNLLSSLSIVREDGLGEEIPEIMLDQTNSKSNTEVETESEPRLLNGEDEVSKPFSAECVDDEIYRNANNVKGEVIEKEKEEDENINNPADSTKEHRIFVHSCWLAVQSSYFRALLFSGMKESHSKEVFMRMTEKELSPHLTLIEAMYKPDVLDDKDYDLVLKVLTLANKYDVALVFKKCKYVLMDVPLSLEVCESILATVNELLNIQDLLSFVEKFLVNEFKPLDKTWRMDKYENLSEAALRLLISSNHLSVFSENTVFVALMHWLEQNDFEETDFVSTSSSLLSLVRFELMTADFLYDIVQHHDRAKGMDDFNELLLNGFSYHNFTVERKEILEIKPVTREECKVEENQPTFTWVIDSGTRKKAASTVYSDDFWWCGYEMNLSLKFESNLCAIYLFVVGTGFLSISWKVNSSLFLQTDAITFKKPFTEGDGWGRDNIKYRCNLQDIQEHESDTIDVYVLFNKRQECFSGFLGPKKTRTASLLNASKTKFSR